MSYNAVVSTIVTSPHPNADRLKLAHAKGYCIVVSIDAQDGDLYVVFPDDGILSDEFCKAADLYPRKDENGVRIGGGFFTEGNARVKAQRFRGVKSEAFALPVASLAFTGYDVSKLKDGDQFDTLNNVKLAEKYYTPATLKAMKNGSGTKPTKKIIMDFPEHKDTTQWRFAHVDSGSLVVITEKLHGTSVRVKRTKVARPLNWWKNTISFFAPFLDFRTDEYVLGTRRTVMKATPSGEYGGGYYADRNEDSGQPYVLALKELAGKLDPEVQVYGELVGYLPSGRALFTHGTEADKELKKQYGGVMEYSYGCPKGQAAFYVYRVTDHGRDLSYFERVAFCKARGLKHVPLLDILIYDGDMDKLNEVVASYDEGTSVLTTSHIREGSAIEVLNEMGSKIYKSKSFSFRLLEGLVKQDVNYVDAEEIA